MIFTQAYLLTFDHQAKIPFDYAVFHQGLTTNPKIADWWHYLYSSYILISSSSVAELHIDIRRLFVVEHAYLLVKVDLKDSAGILPPAAWEWINRGRL